MQIYVSLRNTLLLFLSLISCDLLGNGLKFENHTMVSVEGHHTASSRREGSIYLRVNGVGIPFYTDELATRRDAKSGKVIETRSVGSLDLDVVNVEKENYVDVGVQIVDHSSGELVSIEEGWFEMNLYMLPSSFNWLHLAKLRLEKGGSRTQKRFKKYFLLKDIRPQLYAEIKNLEGKITSLNALVLKKKPDSNKNIFEEIEILDSYLERADFSQDNLAALHAKAVDLPFIKQMFDSYSQNLLELKARIAAKIQQVITTLNTIYHDACTIASELGVHANEIQHPTAIANISLDSLTIPSLEALNPTQTNELAYSHIADDFIQSLQDAFQRRDKMAFLQLVLSWQALSKDYLQRLQKANTFFPRAFALFQEQVEKVSQYLYGSQGPLTRQDWFKVSPVEEEVRQSLKNHILPLSPNEGSQLEKALKALSPEEMTPERQRAIELVKAIGALGDSILNGIAGLAESLAEKQAVEWEYHRLVADATEGVKAGLACVAESQILGRAGSTYELLVGKDVCSGEQLDFWGRAISGVELALGLPKLAKAITSMAAIGPIVLKSRKIVDSAKNIRTKLSNVGEAIPGTTIPKYFNIEAGGKAFHVNPNATEHMGEYINHLPPSHSSPLRNDLILASFEGSVKDAVTSGAWKTSLETRKPILSGGWELIFSQNANDPLPVIIHALMKR